MISLLTALGNVVAPLLWPSRQLQENCEWRSITTPRSANAVSTELPITALGDRVVCERSCASITNYSVPREAALRLVCIRASHSLYVLLNLVPLLEYHAMLIQLRRDLVRELWSTSDERWISNVKGLQYQSWEWTTLYLSGMGGLHSVAGEHARYMTTSTMHIDKLSHIAFGDCSRSSDNPPQLQRPFNRLCPNLTINMSSWCALKLLMYCNRLYALSVTLWALLKQLTSRCTMVEAGRLKRYCLITYG